tara:strand:- start:311 stop:679 length:369 start_codon:yes stop_codon:yes gene_type:complete
MTGTIEQTMKINVLPSAAVDFSQHWKNLNHAAISQGQGGDEIDYAGQYGNFWEISEDTFIDAMEILPPLHFAGNSFAMRERLIGDITTAYVQVGSRFYCGYLRLGNYADDLAAFRSEAAKLT